MDNIFIQRPSTPDTSKMHRDLVEVLKRHVCDLPPDGKGNFEQRQSMSSSSIGISQSVIERTDPVLEISRLEFLPGKIYAIIGKNGVGKSTLFDALMKRSSADIATGGGTGALVINKSQRIGREKLRIARLDQESILKSIENEQVGNVLHSLREIFLAEFPHQFDSIDWSNEGETERVYADEEARQRIVELEAKYLDLFEMNEFMDRKVGELSGGEKTKLSLIMLFMAEPDIVLLDEPTNHLDLVSITKLVQLFKAYSDNGVTVASSSHVTWFLDEASQDGTIEIIYDEKGRRVNQSSAHHANYVKDGSRNSMPTIKGNVEWSTDFNVYTDPMFNTENREFTVANSPLEKISLPSIQAPAKVMLTGKNGTGKTKLLEVLATNERDKTLPVRAKSTAIAYLPQSWPENIASGSVEDFFDWVLAMTNKNDSNAYSKFKKNLKSTEFGNRKESLDSMLKSRLHTFSGGEQRLLWFLAVASIKTDMLILDEPTNHMDKHMQKVITDAIHSFRGAVLVSTHDKYLMQSFANGRGEPKLDCNQWEMTKTNGKTKLQSVNGNIHDYIDNLTFSAKKGVAKVVK